MRSSNLLIISPNLEATRCGVSDYTFILAKQLEQEGYSVFMLSLNDRYTKEIVQKENYLRIPSVIRIFEKIKLTNKFILDIKPRNIYFNFVSYGYHTKGLPIYLLSFLSSIKINVFFIFHEIWIGNFKTEGVRKKLLGFFQRQLVLAIIRNTSSNKVIVVSDVFRLFLSKFKIDSIVVPVFSNISIYAEQKNSLVAGINQFILFGSLPFKTDIIRFVNTIKSIQQELGTPIEIIHVGIWQGYTNDFLEAIEKLKNDKVVFSRKGYLNEKEISAYLNNAVLGLTTYMPAFWAKSGSIAAMLMHGLPVLSISENDTLDNLFNDIETPVRFFSLDMPASAIVTEIKKLSFPDIIYNKIIAKKIVEETLHNEYLKY